MMPPIRHAPTTASVRSPVAASLPVVFLVMTFVVVVSVLGEGLGVGAGVGLADVVARAGEVGRDDGGECAFVIDDQHLGRQCTFAVHVSQYGRDPLSTGELGRAPGRVLMRS